MNTYETLDLDLDLDLKTVSETETIESESDGYRSFSICTSGSGYTVCY
ncbi:hypothetical protein [Clostridium chrysemydis]|nr:hypothetical protein [Clostridium chrysemydis]